MPTECSQDSLDFASLGGRKVTAAFDGGAITSNAGALLLRETDRAIGLSRQAVASFTDGRRQDRMENRVETLIAQRIHGVALGYEDLNDHDELRHDPVLGLVSGKAEARRSDCAVLAGKSTLNRLEHAPKNRRRPLSQAERGRGRNEKAVRQPLSQGPRDGARAHRPRSRRDRRPHPWRSGRPVLPRLLPMLLLSAALYFLRPGAAFGETASREHRRLGWRQGRDRRNRRPNPAELAQRRDLASGGFRVLPRGVDGVVRVSRRPLRLRPCPQSPARSLDRRRTGRGRG